jgi:formate dehydrogenase accessory protein FdhD
MSSPSAFAPSARVGQPSGSFLGNRLKVESDLIVEAGVILQCVNRLNSDAKIFGKTGGAHVAAIYRGGGDQEALAEDVGRHNAVDKVIGIGALSNVDFGMCFLALSGRLTSDIVLKAARVGLPIVASLAAAIDSGIAIASDAKLTLVGFVRGKRMNIYTYANRILLEE